MKKALQSKHLLPRIGDSFVWMEGVPCFSWYKEAEGFPPVKGRILEVLSNNDNWTFTIKHDLGKWTHDGGVCAIYWDGKTSQWKHAIYRDGRKYNTYHELAFG